VAWAETATPGEYQATYVAETVGTNLTATLQLAGWGGTVSSSAYAITVDIATARVTNLTSSINKITGTDAEMATLTATVQDAYGNLVPNYSVTWTDTGTGTGRFSGGTAQTDANGVQTQDYSVLHVATSNSSKTVTATGEPTTTPSNSPPIEVRAVISVNNKYYWTMYSDHANNIESEANNLCLIHGNGTTATQTDLQEFAFPPSGGGGDFIRMSVSGEFGNNWYSLGNTWSTLAGDFHSAAQPVGDTLVVTAPAAQYVCVATP
jgi:adhesin/invasin